jgi:hypothetical protein
LAGSRTELQTARPCRRQTGERERLWVIGEQNMETRFCVNPFQCTTRQNHGTPHRHCLEHLILDAAGYPHRGNSSSRVSEIWPYIRDPTRHHDTINVL